MIPVSVVRWPTLIRFCVVRRRCIATVDRPCDCFDWQFGISSYYVDNVVLGARSVCVLRFDFDAGLYERTRLVWFSSSRRLPQSQMGRSKSFMAAAFQTCHCRPVYREMLDHPRTLFGDPHLVTKYRGNRICRFEITATYLFAALAWKCLYMFPLEDLGSQHRWYFGLSGSFPQCIINICHFQPFSVKINSSLLLFSCYFILVLLLRRHLLLLSNFTL